MIWSARVMPDSLPAWVLFGVSGAGLLLFGLVLLGAVKARRSRPRSGVALRAPGTVLDHHGYWGRERTSSRPDVGGAS